MARFLVLILCLFNFTIARAAVTCDALLAAASAGPASETDELARVYVNLIQFYINQRGQANSVDVVNMILNSDKFVNPFEGVKETLEIQLSDAIKKIRPQISEQVWATVKINLVIANKERRLIEAEQEIKSDETAWLSTLAEPFNSDSLSSGGTNFSPSVHIIGNRVLIAVVPRTLGTIVIYEITNGNLEEVTSFGCQRLSTSSPEWLTIGERTFLVVGSSDDEFNFFEFKDDELKHLKISSDERILARNSYPSWLAVGEKVFLAVGNDSGRLYLFELIDGQLVKIGVYSSGFGEGHAPSWQIKDGKILLLYKCNVNKICLYEFVDNKLELRDYAETKSEFLSHPSFHRIGEKLYFVIGLKNKSIQLYEVVNNKLKRVGRNQIADSVVSKPVWTTIGDRNFLLLSTSSSEQYLYELVNNRLQINTKLYDFNSFYSSEWLMVGGQMLSAGVSASGMLGIYEIINGKLELIYTKNLRGRFNARPVFKVIKDQVYIVLATANYNPPDRIYAIKAFEKTKKQGGGK